MGSRELEPELIYKLLSRSARRRRARTWLPIADTLTPRPAGSVILAPPDVDATVRHASSSAAKWSCRRYTCIRRRMAHLQEPQGRFSPYRRRRAIAVRGAGARLIFHGTICSPRTGTPHSPFTRAFGWKDGDNGHGSRRGPIKSSGRAAISSAACSFRARQPGGPLWIPYVMVADARRTADIAKESGATIAHGPSEVPGACDWVFTVSMAGRHVRGTFEEALSLPQRWCPRRLRQKPRRKKSTRAAKESSSRARPQSRKKPTNKIAKKNGGRNERLSTIVLALFALSAQTGPGWGTLFTEGSESLQTTRRRQLHIADAWSRPVWASATSSPRRAIPISRSG